MRVRFSSEELTFWRAKFLLDPVGEERADFRSAIVASTIANIWRGKGSSVRMPTDYMPYRKANSPPMSDAMLTRRFLSWAKRNGVKDI